jgi:hypothetical protein
MPAPIPVSDGSGYPWGDDPWPGTVDDGSNHYHYDDTAFQTALSRLVNVRSALGAAPPAPGNPPSKAKKTPGDHLSSAGDIHAADFGKWLAATRLYGDARIANDLMVGAYTHFLAAFDAVIEKLHTTAKTNTGVEAENVQVVNYVDVDTVEPAPLDGGGK